MSKQSFAALLLFISIILCIQTGFFWEKKTAVDIALFTSYRDIPGITDKEIADIEALQKEYEYFIFGMTPSAEAFLDENGDINGFSALFCEWLTDLFSIPFIPEHIPLSDFIANFESFEIAFTGDMTPTEERRNVYLMTGNIATRPIQHFRIEGSEPFFEIEKSRPLRYAFIEGATTIDDVAFKLIPGTFESVFINNIDDIYDALLNGEVDSFISEGTQMNTFNRNGDVYTEDFYPLILNPVSMATANPAFESIISLVTKAIENGVTPYLNNLYNQGYEAYKKSSFLLQLSEEEKAYLQDTVSVPIAIQYFNYPIVFYDDHQRKWDGITIDLLREVEKITGLVFEPVNNETTEMAELIAMLNDGRAHMFSDLVFSQEREPHYIWAEHKFMADQYALLSKTNCPNLSISEIPYARVALIRNTAHAEMFNTWFPDAANTILYDTVDDAFRAVEQGKSDLIMVSKTKLLLYVNYYEYSSYKVNFLFNHYYEAALAYNKEQTVLRSIVDKALSVINVNLIVEQWFTKSYDYKSQQIAAQRPWLIGAVTLSLIVIVLILILFYRSRKAAIAELDANERFKIMLDSTPLCCQLFDNNFNKIDCNEEAVRLFGFYDKQEYLERYSELYPEYQPDGQRSDEKARHYIKKAFEEGRCSFDWSYKMLDGSFMPADVVFVRVKRENDYVVAGYTRDLRQYNDMMANIEYRDKLLYAVNHAAELLLGSDVESFENALNQSLKKMAESVNADRIYIWKNNIVNNRLCHTQIYEWSENAEPQQGLSSTVDLPYSDISPEWEKLLSNGTCINGLIRDMSPQEQTVFSSQGILSIAVAPISINNLFWGIVGFDDCHNERVFTKEEEAMLRSGGLLVANAMIRNEQTTKLKVAHERVKVIMEASPIGTTLWDKNGNLFDCNEAYVRLLNLKNVNEFLERHYDFSLEYQPDGWLSSDKLTAMVKKAFDEGRSDFEWTHRAFGGELIPCHVTMVRVAYEGDYAVSGYLRDLREHKAMMSAIERQGKLLNVSNQVASALLKSETGNFGKELVHCLGMIGNAVDADRASIWKNSIKDGRLYCTLIYEWLENAESQINKTITQDIQYDDVIPGWENALSTGNCINSFVQDMPKVEQEHLTRQGILSVCVTPIFVRGQFWGYMRLDHCHQGRLLDETELDILRSCGLMVANTLLRHDMIQEMLEGMERERDLEIQKQAAHAASDAKTHFLASMSHEIRTPMNAIIGMSDLLLSEDLNIRQHRYVEDIKISSIALLDIINDILDISKIQTAKLSLIPVHYNFKALIEHISSMILFLIKDKGKNLVFTVDMQGELPECLYGDDVRLRQVFLNLLSNAVKFTDKGRIALTVSVERSIVSQKQSPPDGFIIDSNDSNLVLTVTDTGSGIPEEDLPTIFDAFEQADTRKNRSYQGTGLGLTITKSLVELMGGHISIESEYGKGTTFRIVLPFVVGDKTLIKNINTTDSIVYAPDAQVLVVDDRETNLSVICGLLHQCQIIADKALSGAKAIEMTNIKQYDLIFMDHMMPEMDGIETTKALRDKGVSVPIVALTANAISGARELLLSSGMDDFLSKPIDKAELYRVLNEWIPSEKITGKLDISDTHTVAVHIDDNEKSFWDMINKIKGLSAETGLDLASGKLNVYKSTLEISMREIDKSVTKLVNFLMDNDMRNFCIEVHGLKGSLSLIGATELSSKALKLENASRKEDIEFCKLNISEFTGELTNFNNELKNAYEELWKNKAPLIIPPELPPILVRINEAMANTDFVTLFDELDLLNEFELTGELKDEIDRLKEAVMIMNYDYAADIMERLLGEN